MKTKFSKYVLCICNTNLESSLEIGKVYQAIRDKYLEKDDNNLIRVIDESGESYIHVAEWFVPIKIPKKIAEKLFKTGA
jgi:hypothetical protein